MIFIYLSNIYPSVLVHHAHHDRRKVGVRLHHLADEGKKSSASDRFWWETSSSVVKRFDHHMLIRVGFQLSSEWELKQSLYYQVS